MLTFKNWTRWVIGWDESYRGRLNEARDASRELFAYLVGDARFELLVQCGKFMRLRRQLINQCRLWVTSGILSVRQLFPLCPRFQT